MDKKGYTMKQIRKISILVLLCLLMLALASCGSKAKGESTLALGDGWTDVFRGQGGEDKTVELVNTATSGYDVQFRILSVEAKVLSGPETMASGYSRSVECPTVPFVVQARAADGMKREYTLAYQADKPLEVCSLSENLEK